MRWPDHERKDGHLAAWRELNQRVADDIEAGEGDIVPVIHKRKQIFTVARVLHLTGNPPGRLWSLWDMLTFNASAFCSVVSNLDALRHHHYNRLHGGALGAHSETVLQQEQSTILDYLRRNLGTPLFSTVLSRKMERLTVRLSDPAALPTVCCTLIDELKLDLQAELEAAACFVIDEEKIAYFQQDEPLFGTKVDDAFPDANKDIWAAGRSYALELWTATVFHLMRVLEHGLRPMAQRFNVPFELDSWHKVIRGIEDGLNDLRNKQSLSEQDRKEITYYSDAAAQFRHFKDAWRNHVSHAREHYDESDAEKVLTHVREFMRHLATPV